MSTGPAFGFVPGSRYQGDADAVGRRLLAIKSRLGKDVKCRALQGAVVDDARPKASPLHRYFEWNNTKAAEEYRMDQARHLIQAVTIIREDAPESEPTRAIVTLIDSPANGSKYYTLGEVQSDSEVREAYLAQALREAHQWMDRYKRFEKELALAFDGIRKAASKANPNRRKGGRTTTKKSDSRKEASMPPPPA